MHLSASKMKFINLRILANILIISAIPLFSFGQSGQNGLIVWQVGNYEIWYQDYVNSGVATKLFTSDKSIDRIQVSPNGKFVSFRKNETLVGDLNLAGHANASTTTWSLWVINFDKANPNPQRFYSNIDFGNIFNNDPNPTVFDHSWDKSGNFIYVGMSSTSTTYDNFILKLSFPRPNVSQTDPVKIWKIGDNYTSNMLLFTHSNDGYFYYRKPDKKSLGRISSATSNSTYTSSNHRYWEGNIVANYAQSSYEISSGTSKSSSAEKDSEQKKEFLKNVKSKIRELNDYVAKNAEFVGDKFVSEVRSIHYDKKKKRNIYGNATLEETKELQEEGIDVATIPWAPKEDA
ncbi:MAG: hypothetical protein RJA80_731 [Actinomycetota bacterium]